MKGDRVDAGQVSPYEPPRAIGEPGRPVTVETPTPVRRWLLAGTVVLSTLLGLLGGLGTVLYLIESPSNQDRHQFLMLPAMAAHIALPVSLTGFICWRRCRFSMPPWKRWGTLILLGLPFISFGVPFFVDTYVTGG